MKKAIIILSLLCASCSYCGWHDNMIDPWGRVERVEREGKYGLFKVTIKFPAPHIFYTDSLYAVGDSIHLFHYKKRQL